VRSRQAEAAAAQSAPCGGGEVEVGVGGGREVGGVREALGQNTETAGREE